MTIWFIDLKVLSIDNDKCIKELCVMNVNDVLNPTHYVFYEPFSDNVTNYGLRSNAICQTCLYDNLYKNDLFYVVDSYNGDNIKNIKSIFPCLRITNYNMSFTSVPANINCPWRAHGDICAYKQCLVGALDYLKNV